MVLKSFKSRIRSVASLFAGIGGIDLGFMKAGCRVVWANEIDEKACRTYSANFAHNLIYGDIKDLNPHDLKEVDILTAGFPCQAFSVAGYRKGFADQRGTLFFDVMDIVKILKPRVLFLENVKNLKSHNKGETFSEIIKEIKNAGYFLTYKVLNTCEYSDIPQNRERLYMICFKEESDFQIFKFPQKAKERISIPDMLDKEVPDFYYYDNSSFYEQLKKDVNRKDTCYQWRRKYVRENKSGLCPTLTANMGMGGHNVPLVLDEKSIRKLTPRECLRFQGFCDEYKIPEDLSDNHIYKQAGNSVSVPVIEKIAKNILKALDENDNKKE